MALVAAAGVAWLWPALLPLVLAADAAFVALFLWDAWRTPSPRAMEVVREAPETAGLSLPLVRVVRIRPPKPWRERAAGLRVEVHEEFPETFTVLEVERDGASESASPEDPSGGAGPRHPSRIPPPRAAPQLPARAAGQPRPRRPAPAAARPPGAGPAPGPPARDPDDRRGTGPGGPEEHPAPGRQRALAGPGRPSSAPARGRDRVRVPARLRAGRRSAAHRLEGLCAPRQAHRAPVPGGTRAGADPALGTAVGACGPSPPRGT